MIVANCGQRLPPKQGERNRGRGRQGRRKNKREKPLSSFLLENIPFSKEKHILCTGPKAHSLRWGHEHQLRKASVNAKFPFYIFGSHAIESPGPVGHLLLSLPSGGRVSYLPALKGLVLAQLAPSHAPPGPPAHFFPQQRLGAYRSGTYEYSRPPPRFLPRAQWMPGFALCQKPGLGMRRGRAPRCRSEPLITVAPALACSPSMALHAKLLQSCPTLCDPRECSPPGSSVHGILQAVGCHALSQGIFPTQGSNPRLMSPALAGRFFTTSATWEAQVRPCPALFWAPGGHGLVLILTPGW